MRRVETSNNLEMITPDNIYFWRVLRNKYSEGKEYYEMTLQITSNRTGFKSILELLYDSEKGILMFNSVKLAIPFRRTAIIIISILGAGDYSLLPIYHKDTIEIKKEL